MNGALDVSGVVTAAGFTIGSAVIAEAELELIDGLTAGTAIASKVVTTDANIDSTGMRNLTLSGELDAATLDISGNADIDGTTNLDVVDIDGATQIDATVTVGVDDTGYDVKFFGATSGAYMLWDESVDDLILAGASRVVVPDGQLVLGSTAVTSTAAELNLLDGVSGLVQADLTKLAAVDSTAAELNLLNGVSGLVQADLTKLAAVDSTAAELNIVDGGTSATSTTVVDADRVVMNDNGTMVQVAVTDLAAYFDDEITAMPNLVTTAATTVGALDSGSITSGFGNIDNGASNITSGGLLKIDVDADANDVTGDSATGRLTLGAGEDLNLYHGGTDSYIVNDTGDLVIKNGASDEDILFQGNDGGGAITALTLDMSAAGAASFNGLVTANAGVVVDNITIDGTEIDLSSGNLLIDVAGHTTIDSGGGELFFAEAGTNIGRFANSSSDFIIKSVVNDKDIIFQGTDGGSGITALTLDMSDAGTAIFNNHASFSDAKSIQWPSGNGSIKAEDSLIFNIDSNDDNSGGEGYYFRLGDSTEGIRIIENGRTTLTGTGSLPTNEAQLHVVNNANFLTLMADCSKTSGVSADIFKFQCSQDSSNGSYQLASARNGGGAVFQIADSGNVTNTNNSYGSISDQRIKQNIADATSQWDDIKALKIRKYKMKRLVNRDGADNTPYHLGVVAQELEAAGMNGLVLEKTPEAEDVALSSDFGTLVSGTAENGAKPIEVNGVITGYEDLFTPHESNKIKTVNYSILYMKAIKALQEAMAKIETLETKVQALEDA